jgi:hypothetical protein
MRVKHDFYETPEWQTKALRRRVQIAGTVFECCVGDGSVARMFPDCKLVTNDIDPERAADFHHDAGAETLWNEAPKTDWVVTNPPFNAAMPILRRAVEHARVGVVFLLRLSFMEPTRERGPFLSATPPIGKLFYRAGVTNKTARPIALQPHGLFG